MNTFKYNYTEINENCEREIEYYNEYWVGQCGIEKAPAGLDKIASNHAGAKNDHAL